MFILGWCKAQIACLTILIFIYMMYVNDGMNLNKLTGKKGGNPVFNRLFVVAMLAVFFDGMTVSDDDYPAYYEAALSAKTKEKWLNSNLVFCFCSVSFGGFGTGSTGIQYRCSDGGVVHLSEHGKSNNTRLGALSFRDGYGFCKPGGKQG